jgi:hypothetical protein
LSGHLVEVCDPNPHTLARYACFVEKFHRCPGLRDDPSGYLAFVGHAARCHPRGLASMEWSRTLCRQHRGIDAGATGLGQRHPAGDDGDRAAGDAEARGWRGATAARICSISAASGGSSATTSAARPKAADHRRRSDHASVWRCRHPRNRHLRLVQGLAVAAASSVCRRPWNVPCSCRFHP